MSGYVSPPSTQYGLESGPILLKDGRTALLRPARPTDRPMFVEFLGRLSSDARVRRFFSEVNPDTGADLLLRQKPSEERLTLVVLTGEPGHERIIATGEFVREGAGANSAEVAFLVDDWYQGKGLGSLLLERLALLAAQRGISKFRAFTLQENTQMISVFRESGFDVKTHLDAGEVEIEFQIEPSEKMLARFEFRERVATVASLFPIFKPRAIAVVGASRDPESVGYRVLQNLVQGRFAGPVYPVNPGATQSAGEVLVVGSILAYPHIRAVPGPVDLAVITTPADQVITAAESCGQRGVRALVVLTTGLSREQTKHLTDLCRGYGMRLVGPGSLGVLHTHPDVRMAAGLAAMQAPLPGGQIALSSQSGALGMAVLEYAKEMGLGVASFVSLGAKADLSSNDLMQFWEDDPNTALILLYLESFGNPRRFARLARRVGRKKPLLAVKPGRDPIVASLFAQTGVIQADSLEEMFDIAVLLAHQPLPQGPQVTLLSNASGPATLALETLRQAGLEATHTDLGTTATAEQYHQALSQLLQDPACHTLMVLFVPVGFASAEAIIETVKQALGSQPQAAAQKTLLMCMMTPGRPRVRSGQEPIPTYRFPESAAKALTKVCAYAAWRRQPEGEIPNFSNIQEEAARTLLQDATLSENWLSASDTAGLLNLFGLPEDPQTPTQLCLQVNSDNLFGPVMTLEISGLPIRAELGRRIIPLSRPDTVALLASEYTPEREEWLLRLSRMVEELPSIEHLETLLAPHGLQNTRIRLAGKP